MLSKKITILHVIPMFATGGAERLVLHYARLFDPKKYTVHVATCVDDGELKEKFEQLSHVHLFVTSRKTVGRIQAYRRLANYVEEIKPDIIHTHMLSADLFGWMIKKKYGKNIVWISTMHNNEEATPWLRKQIWRRLLPSANRIISVSKLVQTFTEDKFHIKKNISTLLYNGVDISSWIDIPTEDLLSHKKLQIASVGRMWTQKGHEYLLRALPLLKDKKIDFELHLFGDGPLRHSLEQLAHTLGVYDSIVWHGITQDVPLYIAHVDVAVQPSLWEGLSLVVMEMMAAGRVVVTTPSGGGELIQDKKTGYIIPVKNPHTIAGAIQHIVSDKKYAIEIAQKARTYAKINFDIKNNVLGLQKIYEEELTNKK